MVACQGFYFDECSISSITLNPKVLVADLHTGVDEFKETWYAEPHHRFTSNGKHYIGTFRSTICNQMTSRIQSSMCLNCKNIPDLKSFQKRLTARNENNSAGRNNKTRLEYLNRDELISRNRKKTIEIDTLKDKLFLSQSTNARLKIRSRTLKEELAEFSSRGNMKAITYKLVKASNEGLLKDKSVLSDLLQTVSNNLHREAKGKRYSKSLHDFYEALLILGGPKLATFVATNIGGAGINTIYHWRKQNCLQLKPLPCEENFKQTAEIYKGIMKKLNIRRVPVLMAEDETAIKAVIEYNQKDDELVGFCNVKTEIPKDHRCFQGNNAHFVVGSDENAYENIVQMFDNYKIGGYARVVLLNPLHPCLPRIVALLAATCNKFTNEDVLSQWQQLETLYKRHLEDILGPMNGHSSDGDSRRRKLMLLQARSSEGKRYQPITKDDGFHFSVKKEDSVNEHGGYIIRDCPDQDAIHEGKKLVNPLDHPTRIMIMGNNFMVHMNHLLLVSQRFDRLQHGLSKNHLERTDRQNWKVAQELTFLSVQQCLLETINGNEHNAPDESLKGTYTFLKLVWSYIEIFFSPVATLSKRITYAAYFVHFLGIWRNFILLHDDYNLKTHFITRECYLDGLLSAHFAVILICYMRDNFPNEECRLDKSGSEPCEIFFSMNGQWVGNHHNYTFAGMVRNVNHMARLQMMQADQDGPRFSRAHIKQEDVWHKQYENTDTTVNLKDYPAVGEEIELWRDGVKMAREAAKYVGMVPEFFSGGHYEGDPANSDQSWFFSPFSAIADNENILDQMCLDTELYDNEEENNTVDIPDEVEGGDTDIDFTIHNDNSGSSPDEVSSARSSIEGILDGTITGQEKCSDEKISPTVEVPGYGKQYKSTIVRLLNENPQLSHDRLVRVRQVQGGGSSNVTLNVSESTNANAKMISLFGDYGFKFEGNIKYGRVHRMRKKGKRQGYVEYKKPLLYTEQYLSEVNNVFAT